MPIAEEPSSAKQPLDSLLLQLAGRLVDMPEDLDQTIQAVLAELQHGLGLQCVGLSLLPSGSGDIYSFQHYYAGLVPCPARPLLEMAPELIGQLRHGKVLIHPPPGESLPGWMAAAGMGTVLFVPLDLDDRWQGVLGLATHQPHSRWTSAAITSLQTFGRVAARLIQQAQTGEGETEGETRLRMALEAGGSVDAGALELVTGKFYTTYNVAQRLLGGEVELASSYTDFLELVHPDHRQRLLLAMEEIIDDKKPRCQVEYILLQPNGQQIWVEFNGRMRRDTAGMPRYVEGTFSDITKWKRVEQELNQQRQLLVRQTRLMEQTESVAAIGGWEWDIVADVLYWTPETYRIYGLSPDSPTPTAEEAVERSAPESRSALRAAIERALATGEPYDLEIEIINLHGERIPARTTGRVEMEEGRAVRLYGALQDITQRASLERQLREVKSQYQTGRSAPQEGSGQ